MALVAHEFALYRRDETCVIIRPYLHWSRWYLQPNLSNLPGLKLVIALLYEMLSRIIVWQLRTPQKFRVSSPSCREQKALKHEQQCSTYIPSRISRAGGRCAQSIFHQCRKLARVVVCGSTTRGVERSRSPRLVTCR